MQAPFQILNEKTKHSILILCSLLYSYLQVVEVVVNNDCHNVLTDEMDSINVEFKFYEEFNKLAEKTETKWTNLNGT